MRSSGRGIAAASTVFAAVLVASLAAWRDGAPERVRAGGDDAADAWLLFALLVAAFVAYLVGLALIRRRPPGFAAVAVCAIAIQLAPLAGPLLVSTDAWTYWAYGAIATDGRNPYADAPSELPDLEATRWMGSAWRDTTSVYGPAFTLGSEPLARAVGDSATAAALLYRITAAAALLCAAFLAARLARRRALALALVGWNPVLAIHAGGGGHNDALVGALVLSALVLAVGSRRGLAAALWVLAIAVKWVPIVFLVLHALELRANGRRLRLSAVAAATVCVAAVATWRYGLEWPRAIRPLAANAALETRFALPHRLEQLGAPDGLAFAAAAAAFVAGFAALALHARRGRAYLGRAAVLVLATTPWLAVWYLAWAVPLAAADEDRLGRIGCLAFCAYLLPQAIVL